MWFAISKATAPEDYVGLISFVNIAPSNRSIGLGGIIFSKHLQKSTASTEAFYLMMKYCFEELGYMRMEWKCNVLNEPSKAAALRLGFKYEGTSRQHLVMKGYSCDISYYCMIDQQWFDTKREIERWLQPTNFDKEGQQLTKLNLKTRS